MKKILLLIITQLILFCSVQYAQWVHTKSTTIGEVLCLTSDKSILYAGTANGVFSSTDYGMNWNSIGLTNKQVICILHLDKNLFVGTVKDGAFYSNDNGLTWNGINNNVTSPLVYAIVASGSNLLIGTGGGGIYLSTNNGTIWTSITDNILNKYITSILVSSKNLFVGTGGGIFLSSNNGANWSSFGLNKIHVISLLENDQYLFVTGAEGLFRYSKSKESWDTIDTKAVIKFMGSLALLGNMLLGGTGTGVFISNNNATSWSPVNTGLNDLAIGSLIICDNYVITSARQGTWRRPLSELITAIRDERIIPTSSQLLQNYPNPFNPSTTIKYSLSNNQFVTMKIFDILGREVATLVNETRQVGNNETKFDGGNLSSGIYFYRLQTGNYSEIKKMILVK